MIQVADLADGREAIEMDLADFAGRQSDLRVRPLFGHELRPTAGRPHELSTLADLELDIVDDRAERDVAQWKCIARIDRDFRAGNDLIANGQALGMEDVPLVAISVVQKRDVGRAVRIVLDRGDAGGDVVLVSPEVDLSVASPMPTTAKTNRDPTFVVPSTDPLLALDQRLVWRRARERLEGGTQPGSVVPGLSACAA